MNVEIEKLITHARENGFLTARQRTLIISKAEQLGDDISELEFVLDDIPIGEQNNSPSVIEPTNHVLKVSPASQDDGECEDIKCDDSSQYVYKPVSKKKGCFKGCLWSVIIMFALGLIGYLIDLIF